MTGRQRVRFFKNTWFFLVTCLLVQSLSGCGSLSVDEMADAARQADIRTLVVEPDFAVASPFEPGYTYRLLKLARRNLVAIEALLEVDVPSNLTVHFVALEMPKAEVRSDGEGGFDLKGIEVPSDHGIRAYARTWFGSRSVTIYVAPEVDLSNSDGGLQSVIFDFDSESSIRHELAHICAFEAGLDGNTWFNEGLAEEFESRKLDNDGALPMTALPRNLQVARKQHGPYSIDDVLDWDENVSRVSAGKEKPFYLGRSLSHSLIRFLLDRTPGKSLREKFERILDMKDREIRALEDEWKAWLAALPSGR